MLPDGLKGRLTQADADQVVRRNRVSNAVTHDVYLKEEQIAMKRLMNKEMNERRQQELVLEQGADNMQEFEDNLAHQKARFEASLQAKNEAAQLRVIH